MAHPHTSFLLQFICGLGPRKAEGLLQNIAHQGFLSSRSRLRDFVGPVVATNCAGFIRICAKYFQKEPEDFGND